MKQQQQPAKALRVGLSYNGRMLEEKLFRKPQNVTVGYHHKSDVVLPIGDKPIPKRFPLFVYDKKAKKYYLNVIPGQMTGSLTDKTTRKSRKIEQLSAGKKEIKVPIDENTIGRVKIGDSYILFLFVTAPPPVAKPRLPSSMRGGWLRSIDWHFVALFLVFFIANAVLFTVSASKADLRPKPPDKLLEEFVKVTQMDMKKLEEVMKEEKGEGEGEAEQVKKPKKRQQKVAQKEEADTGPVDAKKAKQRRLSKKIDAAAKKADALLKLAMGDTNSAVFKAIAAQGVAGSADAVIDVATDDGTGANLTAQNLARVKSIKTKGGSGGKKVNVAALGGDVRDMGKYGKAKGGELKKVKTAKMVRRKSRLNFGSAKTSGSGFLSRKIILAGIKTQVGPMVRKCHSRVLGLGEVSGTVVVQFTINTKGKVSKASIVPGRTTVDNAFLKRCVLNAIKRMKFSQKPQGGDVTIVFPFNFGVD